MRLTIFAVRPWTLQVKLNYQRLEGDPDPESDLNPPGRLKIRLGQKYLPGAVFQCAVIFGSATCGNWDIVLFPISYEPPVTEEEKVCMSQDEYKRIGLIVGREWDWPEAFIQTINNSGEGITAELVKVGGTYMNETCPYSVIIDRKSHIIPYYRVYLKFAALQGCTIINNPFTWAADDKFLGTLIINRLGLNSPRTVVLPNKQVKRATVTASFRNLKYPMDWQGIIEYVGVPAIFKDVYSVGRGKVYRVHNVDELIQRYDESGTNTMVLQEIIESDTHIHCFVVGQEQVLALQYSLINGRYLPTLISPTDPIGQQAIQNALALTRTYGYDVNMVEFVVKNNQLYVINSTNPAPVIDKNLMTAEQFTWCVDKIAALAIDRVKRPISQKTIFPEAF